MKRENKNRPREMSSKKTVKRFRDVVGLSAALKSEKRDPRFDNMCGEFDEKVSILMQIFILIIISKNRINKEIAVAMPLLDANATVLSNTFLDTS